MPADSTQPTLVMFAGLPGTGKSTLAAALGQHFGWPVLDKDVLNTVLLNAGLTQAQAGPLAYDLVLALAESLVVQQRQSIILDTAGRHAIILARAGAIMRAGSGRLRVIRCVAPFAERQARLHTRRAGPSQWTQDQTTAEQEAAWYVHLPPDTLIVTSDRPVEELLTLVVPFVQH